MSERDGLIGTSGSFFHTSIFCPPRRILCLNYTEQINSNYAIVDRLAGNEASYHYPSKLRVNTGRTGILTARYLPDARAFALDLLGEISAGAYRAASSHCSSSSITLYLQLETLIDRVLARMDCCSGDLLTFSQPSVLRLKFPANLNLLSAHRVFASRSV